MGTPDNATAVGQQPMMMIQPMQVMAAPVYQVVTAQPTNAPATTSQLTTAPKVTVTQAPAPSLAAANAPKVTVTQATAPSAAAAKAKSGAGWSAGSEMHGKLDAEGNPLCQPCAWFFKASGCQNG